MPFNAERFLADYNIRTDTEGPNSAPGWIQVMCPMPDCDDDNYHGGFNLQSGAYNCWKCGKHPLPQVIQLLARCSVPKARIIIEKYKAATIISTAQEHSIQRPSSIKMPTGCGPLNERARQYLISRQFDPDYLEQKYRLQSTGTLGPYKFRIIAPIYYQGRMVSYQGRDITSLAPQRYKACPQELEIVPHKHMLYGVDEAVARGRRVIVVEGITDQWRLGDGAVATFGIKYTQEQLAMLCNLFEQIFVFYDAEPKAQEQARRLAQECCILGREAEVITPDDNDPASMTDEEARQLMKEFLG